jgi:SOUL heme-binding protein
MFRTLSLGTLLWSGTLMAIDEPKYSVIKEYANDIELRQYDSYIIAETEVRASNADEAGNLAFKRLGGYIFGGNQRKQSIAMTAPVSQAKSEKIAMTAPVNQSRIDDGQWRVSFVMPNNYTLETLPVPNDKSIYFKTVPARRVLAIRFSGRWTDDNFMAHETLLKAALKTHGLVGKGSTWTARYDPPFMPGFMRRNEVMQEVK